MRRLLNLPTWCQDLVNSGELTAAHGKYILPALASDKVMEYVQADIKDDLKFGHKIKVTDIENVVENGFDRHHIDIKCTWSNDPAEFDIATCQDCKTCKKFPSDYRDKQFCLDDSCYQEKQKAARAEAKKIADESPDVDQDDDKAERRAALERGRIEATEKYLDDWLIKQLIPTLVDDYQTSFSIMVWLAAGHPGNFGCYNGHYGSYSETIDSPLFDRKENKAGVDLVLAKGADHIGIMNKTIAVALVSMSRDNLRKIARHCKIELKGNYEIDYDYLAIKSKQELIDSTPELVRDSYDDWKKESKKTGKELIERILDRADKYGIPGDLQSMLNAEDIFAQ